MSVVCVPRTPLRFGAEGVVALSLALCVPPLLGGCENIDLGALPALEDQAPLSREVDAALRADPELGIFGIRVKSLDGDTVRLSGRVDTESQRHTAERVASRVAGVRSVVNTLQLRD